MQHDHVMKNLISDLLTSSPRVVGGGRGEGKYLLPCCCILWFPLIWYATRPCSEKAEIWPFDSNPRARGVGLCSKISWIPLIWYASWPCFEQSWLDLLTRSPGSGVWGVCRQNICYHAAAFVIPFNLICDRTTFWNSGILTFWPHP